MDDIYLGTLKAGDVKKVGTELSSVFFLIFFFSGYIENVIKLQKDSSNNKYIVIYGSDWSSNSKSEWKENYIEITLTVQPSSFTKIASLLKDEAIYNTKIMKY